MCTLNWSTFIYTSFIFFTFQKLALLVSSGDWLLLLTNVAFLLLLFSELVVMVRIQLGWWCSGQYTSLVFKELRVISKIKAEKNIYTDMYEVHKGVGHLLVSGQ
jgi:hypothetical protein